jgi:hypothetical protein
MRVKIVKQDGQTGESWINLEILRQSAKVVGAEKSEARNNLKVRVVHHKTIQRDALLC